MHAPTDAVIYELHVRDFSIGDSTVRPDYRGKYLAFTLDDTDGMRHLKSLAAAGITDVHLLPVFDFGSVPETGCVTPTPVGTPDGESQQQSVSAVSARDCFNWGYDPVHFTAPEGSYATDSADGAVRVVEFRRMVQALHRAGLRVGMDVVYNHTYASGQDSWSVLDRIVPGYYHRLDEAGRVTTSTCCANTATEHRMMAKLMADSAVTWAREYRIDSFRFDLMGHQPRAAMEELQQRVNAATGRDVLLIGEGWNFGEVADGARFVQASQLSLNGSGIATFSDRARDAIRGGGAGDNDARQVSVQGYVNGLHYDPNADAPATVTATDLMRTADMVRVGLAGSLRSYRLPTFDGRDTLLEQIPYAGNQPAGYVTAPGEVVNYVENHDNQTLYDLHAFKLPLGTSSTDRARAQILAAALNAFSQGIAYYHAGIELLRSKSMDRNSFDSGDWFNRIDWTGQDNFFGTGLPPAKDNAASWPLMRPRLADPQAQADRHRYRVDPGHVQRPAADPLELDLVPAAQRGRRHGTPALPEHRAGPGTGSDRRASAGPRLSGSRFQRGAVSRQRRHRGTHPAVRQRARQALRPAPGAPGARRGRSTGSRVIPLRRRDRSLHRACADRSGVRGGMTACVLDQTAESDTAGPEVGARQFVRHGPL